jgi:hypothetical protein
LGPIEEDPSGLRAFRVNRSREAKTGRGKRVVLDEETWRALDLLMREQMKSFEEISAEAFRDLLRKYGQPENLKAALKESMRSSQEASPRSGGRTKLKRK